MNESEWHEIPDDGLFDHIGGLTYRKVGKAFEAKLDTQPHHRNYSGVTHGGITMTLIDRVIGVNLRQQLNVPRSVTVTLTVNFLRSAPIGSALIARCIFRKAGKNTVFADAEVWSGEDLIATGTGVYQKVAPLPAAKA
jgi:uncharacterized protein (TIGR00369 family)